MEYCGAAKPVWHQGLSNYGLPSGWNWGWWPEPEHWAFWAERCWLSSALVPLEQTHWSQLWKKPMVKMNDSLEVQNNKRTKTFSQLYLSKLCCPMIWMNEWRSKLFKLWVLKWFLSHFYNRCVDLGWNVAIFLNRESNSPEQHFQYSLFCPGFLCQYAALSS